MSCAMAGAARIAAAASRRVARGDLRRFMLLAPLQDEFLHAPGFDFAHDDLVGIAAVHHVNHLEARRQLAGMAELADHGAVQLQLVDLAGLGPASRPLAVWG